MKTKTALTHEQLIDWLLAGDVAIQYQTERDLLDRERPDLRGRIPVHQGNGFILAETGGAEEITLTVSQIPAHSHPWLASESAATAITPAGNMPAEASKRFYVTPSTTAAMAPNAVSAVGGSQPHTNFQPYLCVNFIISLFGIFPSPT